MSQSRLSQHAQQIWFAGVAAAHAGRQIQRQVHWDRDTLVIESRRFPVRDLRSIFIAGAGKAAAAMTEGLLRSLWPECRKRSIGLGGQIHVPQTHGISPEWEQLIEVRAVRPLNYNWPTIEAVRATARMRRKMLKLSAADLCIALISGGGSALLCQPAPAVSLEEQIATIQILSDNGVDIRQLNRVRACLDEIKAGGLVQDCRANIAAFVLSDVIGDDLSLVASGPTWPATRDYNRARQVVGQWDPDQQVPTAVWRFLKQASDHASSRPQPSQNASRISHILIGNTATAVQGAVEHARSLGYRIIPEVAVPPEQLAEKAQELVERLLDCKRATCLISGGEPLLSLLPIKQRGRGGRNLHMVLTSLRHWLKQPAATERDFCLLSAGTDGEDGNMPAAGGWCDTGTLSRLQAWNPPWEDYLDRQDAGSLLAATGNLLVTPRTHTNVCDLRVYICGDRPSFP